MTRSRWRAPLALTLIFGLAISVAACGSSKKNSSGASTTTMIAGPSIRLAAQDSTEDKTAVEVYGQYLKAKGFNVDLQKPVGARKLAYDSLEANKLDMIIDYTGSAVTSLDPTKTGSADAAATASQLAQLLAARQLVSLRYASAEDQNALVALKTYADAHSLTKISDLAKLTGTVTLAGAPECQTRPDCLGGYNNPSVYGLHLKFQAVAYGPPLVAALQANTVQVAQYQTTAPEVADGTIVVLTDDKGLFSSDNIVPVLRKALADAYGTKLSDAIDELSAKVTTADLAAWNNSTDVKKEDPADVAKAWLTQKGLL